MPRKSQAPLRDLKSPYVWTGVRIKMRYCRRCLKLFRSTGKGHRICDSCDAKPEHYDVKEQA